MTIDTVMNTLVLMSALPEIGVPADQTHIVASTAVLRNVQYGDDGAGREALVSYDASEPRSVEKIRVQAAALSSGIEVLLDGVALPRRAGAIPGDFAGTLRVNLRVNLRAVRGRWTSQQVCWRWHGTIPRVQAGAWPS